MLKLVIHVLLLAHWVLQTSLLFIIYYWIVHQDIDRHRNTKGKKLATHKTRIQSNTDAREQVNKIDIYKSIAQHCDLSLSITMSCNRLHIIYHGIVREVHKKCMKLQTSSRSKPNERDLVLLRIKIDSNKAPYMAATPESNLRKKFCKQICGDTTWISRKVKPNLVLQNCALDKSCEELLFHS